MAFLPCRFVLVQVRVQFILFLVATSLSKSDLPPPPSAPGTSFIIYISVEMAITFTPQEHPPRPSLWHHHPLPPRHYRFHCLGQCLALAPIDAGCGGAPAFSCARLLRRQTRGAATTRARGCRKSSRKSTSGPCRNPLRGRCPPRLARAPAEAAGPHLPPPALPPATTPHSWGRRRCFAPRHRPLHRFLLFAVLRLRQQRARWVLEGRVEVRGCAACARPPPATQTPPRQHR
mmetsp:Transcript_67085/g.131565  ORF Transcript_67085/g.131565 Transcript_67085/m.131565 type:complete len:232 (+) Transcript_67085:145-840(+)